MSSARLSRSLRGRSGRDRSAPLILLVGTPGTGKRPLGSYLEDEHGFVHVDLGHRAARERLLASGDDGLRREIARLAERGRGVIFTWTAGSCDQLAEIGRLRAAGVEALWCDSDRGAALRAHYADAGRVPRLRYLDTFEFDGRFRPVEAVVGELLRPAPRRQPRRPRIPAPGPELRLRLGVAGAAFAGAAAVAMAVLVGIVGGNGAAPRATPALAGHTLHQAPTLPRQGVLVSGRSLAGVQLGDTMAQVRAHWGGHFTRCAGCKPAMWFYTYPPPSDPVGAGVQFANGRVVAVFTLGSPIGWHTDSGIRVGQILNNPSSGPRWLSCAGYSAKPTEVSKVAVTSILTQGAAVYGFALTRPSVSPCLNA
jgi:hypothetical protein